MYIYLFNLKSHRKIISQIEKLYAFYLFSFDVLLYFVRMLYLLCHKPLSGILNVLLKQIGERIVQCTDQLLKQSSRILILGVRCLETGTNMFQTFFQ